MLHIIYRAYAGENKKGRPPYYDKLIALLSFIHAFQRLEAEAAEIIYITDGDMPADRRRAMEAREKSSRTARWGCPPR